LAEGGLLRVAYDGKTGHPYTSIGRLLVARGVAPAEQMTADRLRAWLEADAARGEALMRENRSFIFFRALEGLIDDLGAVAAAGVQITPGRSLAVDRLLHTFGSPIWLETDLPTGTGGAVEPLRRLMIAQDTGSAIVGPARGDFFYGLGDEAGRLAGLTRHQPERFVVLVPSEG
jgi:membrane-bound lytic murein transglycosylase A